MKRNKSYNSHRKRAIRAFLFKKYGNICYYCKQNIKKENLTLDHFFPVSKGGTSHRSNLRLACLECNQKKAAIPGGIYATMPRQDL